MIVGVCRLIANHLHLAFFESIPEVRVLSSTGITRILPCPTPADAAARSDVEAAALAPNGSPPITRTTLPTCRAHYPGGSRGCACRLLPHACSFPKWPEGRHPHCHFRGLLRLHSRYGPSDRSAAHRRPLSRGSNPCGYPHKPLVSYRINRQLSGWIPPPLMIRAFGAHCHNRTHAVQHT